MSEMTALEYLKAKARMSNNCLNECAKCPLYTDGGIHTCIDSKIEFSEKSIEIVKKWAKENPIKSYKDVFFEKFPNAAKSEIHGYPLIDVRYIFGGKFNNCGEYYKAWDEEYQEPRP